MSEERFQPQSIRRSDEARAYLHSIDCLSTLDILHYAGHSVALPPRIPEEQAWAAA